jgi:hypothetical protein
MKQGEKENELFRILLQNRQVSGKILQSVERQDRPGKLQCDTGTPARIFAVENGRGTPGTPGGKAGRGTPG